METDEDEEDRTGRGRSLMKNLTSLLTRTLAIVVVSLTVFNFYLLAWLWSSLGNGQSIDQRIMLDPLKLWQSDKSGVKLSPRSSLQVDRVLSSGAKLRLKGSESVEFELAGQSDCKLLQLDGRSQRISFPSGVSIASASGKTKLDCNSEPNGGCCTPEAAVIKLCPAQSAPIDFDRKSLEVRQRVLLHSRGRIHSATSQLRLLSSDRTTFESQSGHLNLTALDDILLASRRSFVSIHLYVASFFRTEALDV